MKDVMIFIVLVMIVLLFWNFEGPDGEEYKHDLFDLIYMEMSDETE